MAEAEKTITLQLTTNEKTIVILAMSLLNKSLERAARSNELMGRKAIADSIRQEQILQNRVVAKLNQA